MTDPNLRSLALPRRAALLGGASLLAAPMVARAQAAPKTSIAVRIDRQAEVLDPAYRTSLPDANICRAIYQRLSVVAPGNTGAMELDAASALTQVSPTVVEFTLKPGQMFTGGYGEVTAEDVKFSYERFAVSPMDGKASPYKGDWADLKEVEVTGKYTGRIVMQKPRAALMLVAIGGSSGSIVCKKAVMEKGIAAFGIGPVGSGAMVVDSFERQRGVVLKRNPDYKGVPSGYAEIAVRYVQDPKTAELGLRSGELDFALMPPQSAGPLKAVPELDVTEAPGLSDVWIGLNIEKKPFDDIRVRQAFRLALDVDQMILAGYNGLAPRANACIMPQVLGYWPDAPVTKRDVARAKALLAEGGLAQGFKCRMIVQNQPVFQTMALVAQALLAEVGITLEVVAQDSGAFFSAGKGDAGKTLDTFMIRFNGNIDPNFTMQWFTTSQIGIWNWQRWSDPQFDGLLDQAATELEPPKRAALIVEAQKRMAASEAFVWLTWDVNVVVARKGVTPSLLASGIDWELDRFAPG